MAAVLALLGGCVTVLVLLGPLALWALVLALLGAVVFIRQPVTVLLGFWVFALAQPTLAALVGRSSALGAALGLVDHAVVAVLLVCTILMWAALNPSVRLSLGVPALGFAFAGVFSAFFHGVPLTPMALGGWSNIKLWVLLFVTTNIQWSPRDVDRLERVLRWSVYVIVIGVFANAIAPATFSQVLSTNSEAPIVRVGLTSLQSFFTHPSHLASFSGVGFAIYLARLLRTGDPRDRRMLLLCVGCGLVSLKLKTLLTLVAAVGAAVLAAPRAAARRVGGLALAGVLVIGLASGGVLGELVRTQVERYLGSDESIRYQLYKASFAMGQENFPLGEGFGRFGSGAATRYYSPVYAKYGLSNRGGLQEDAAVAAHDTTWPTVLGESGYLGLLFFAGGVILLFIAALRRARATASGIAPPWLDLAVVTLLGGLIAESFGRSSFFKLYTALAAALIIGASVSMRSGTRPTQPALDPTPTRAVAGWRR